MTPADPAARIRAALDRLAQGMDALGVAVSGGGDSVALMRIVADWAGGRRIMVATVDHGLRPESRAEAIQVAHSAAALGLPHAILPWLAPGGGNLMAEARQARLRLLSDWARANHLPAIALGHTADDQAETLMMRLARGAGIDGLAAMTPARRAHGILWLRPMLEIRRAELRDWLRSLNTAWIDDPSNERDEYERVRIRKAIGALGLDATALARSAAHLAQARDALSHYAAQAARGATARNGALALPLPSFRDAPSEIRRRLLVAGCRWITGAGYPPRRATLLHALTAIEAGKRVTLDGVLIEADSGQLRLLREPAAAMRAPPGKTTWDDRWHINGLQAGEHIAALGYEPLSTLDWRAAGLSRHEAAASPAIWQGPDLAAAPLLEPGRQPRIRPLRDATDFHMLVIAH